MNNPILPCLVLLLTWPGTCFVDCAGPTTSSIPSNKPSRSQFPSGVRSSSPTNSPSGLDSYNPTTPTSYIPSNKPSRSPFPSGVRSSSPTNSPSGLDSYNPTTPTSSIPSNKPSRSSFPSGVLSSNPTSPPSGLDLCNITLDVICRENSTGLPCDELYLVVDECLELPTYMSFRYKGGDCNQSSNIQPPEDFVCEDFHGGPPTNQGESCFIVTTNVDNGVIHHADFVRVGELFTVEEIDGAFPSAMNITVYSSNNTSEQNILQTVVMNTSCSQNLFLTDRYGSFHLIGFVNELQGNVSSLVDATYSFVVSNAATEFGSGTATLNLLTSISNEFYNLTEEVNGMVLSTNDSMVVQMAFIIDLSVLMRYTVFSIVQAVSPGGFVCRDQYFDAFIAPTAKAPPTAAPTVPQQTMVFCFSGESLVDVKGKGSIQMKNLKIGDMVQTGNSEYEQVYSFGHYAPDMLAQFLQVHVKDALTPLSISSDHMVFVKSRGGFVPASDLKEGDQLVDGAGNELSVASIDEKDKVLGVFAPFTPSGKIVVNNILASSFVAMDSKLTIGGVEFSNQWTARTFEFPHRVACHYMGQCPNEVYDEDGISMWVSTPHKIGQWLLTQNSLIWNMFFASLVAMLSVFAVVEALFVYPASLVIVVAAAHFYYYRRWQNKAPA